jgi:hypothetical protein
MHRFGKACLLLVVPLACLAADDSPPACGSRNQGQMWPEAANHNPKLISRLVRCGELLICVRGTWHYHWESPTVRLDQLDSHAKSKASKPAGCEVESMVDGARADPSRSKEN